VKSDHPGISVDEGLEDTRLLPTIRGAGPKTFFRSPSIANKKASQQKSPAEGRALSSERFWESVLVSTPEVVFRTPHTNET
jgi:hypothetical protein